LSAGIISDTSFLRASLKTAFALCPLCILCGLCGKKISKNKVFRDVLKMVIIPSG
jgi:hypothetical protein